MPRFSYTDAGSSTVRSLAARLSLHSLTLFERWTTDLSAGDSSHADAPRACTPKRPVCTSSPFADSLIRSLSALWQHLRTPRSPDTHCGAHQLGRRPLDSYLVCLCFNLVPRPRLISRGSPLEINCLPSLLCRASLQPRAIYRGRSQAAGLRLSPMRGRPQLCCLLTPPL